MVRTFYDFLPESGPGIDSVQLPEPDPGGEQADEGTVDVCLVKETGGDGFRDVAVGTAAVRVRTGMDRLGDGVGGVRTVFMVPGLIEIADRPTVGGDESLIPPFPPEDGIDQIIVGAAGNATETVVGDHHFLHTCPCHEVLECGEIGLAEIPFRYDRIVDVAVPFRAGMDGEMLCAGVGLQHRRIGGTLQSSDDRHPQPPGQVRILPVGLHASSPAGVPEDVDIRSPECKSLILF